VADSRAVGEADARARYAVLDHAGTLPGRGAYLCRATDTPATTNPDCLAALAGPAARRGAIARALRCPVTLDPKLVESVNP
jgi:predicted RNA-binding protein YlxR (DUF448 family)